jgi:hypothetical protein
MDLKNTVFQKLLFSPDKNEIWQKTCGVMFYFLLQGQDGVGGDKGEDGDPGQPVSSTGIPPYLHSLKQSEVVSQSEGLAQYPQCV